MERRIGALGAHGGTQALRSTSSQCRAHPEAETGCSGTKRFEIELEFVQCLANPHYINCEQTPAIEMSAALQLSPA